MTGSGFGNMESIEQCVYSHARTNPDRVAVVCNGRTITYGRLWQMVGQQMEELRAGGIGKGSLYSYRTTQDETFLCSYMAAHALGAVAVPLGSDMPPAEFMRMQASLNGTVLNTRTSPAESIADVLFTTGTTGKQKGVMLSYRAIMADTDNLITAQGFSSDTNFVVCGPLNHIGSLSKTWPVLALGGTLILLEGMKDINSFFSALSYADAHMATFMVPASIRMMLRLGKQELEALARRIDFIETGGAAISQSDMKLLCDALPDVRLYNTYASTEAGIVCTYDYNHNPCVAGCCGRSLKHSGVSVDGNGSVVCSGSTLMSGYLNDEAATAEVLRNGTLITSDLGSIGDNGMLYLRGRNGDVVNIGGYKVSPLEVEEAALSHPLVADCVCYKAQSPIFGPSIKLEYVIEPGHELSKKELARHLASKLEAYKVPRLFEQTTAIRRLFNGKLDRKYYNGNSK